MGHVNTYELEAGPPPMHEEECRAAAEAELAELLASDPPEPEIQRLLERNPALVPGAWTPGRPSGHPPLHDALIVQPELPGLRSKFPDFMWIASHSGTWFPTLVEIERPGKQIFRSRGRLTSEFTEARNQLAQWRAWFDRPENVQKFIVEYGVPDRMARWRSMRLHMILVFGRREEFSEDAELSRQRSSLMPGADEELVSYDRLHFDEGLRDCISVRAKGDGAFEAVAIPRGFTLGPASASRLRRIRGIRQAIEASEIADDRREFLLRRVGYWREWAALPGMQAYTSGDFE